jgi:hypothetical protein
MVAPAYSSVIGDSIDYSLGLQDAPDVLGLPLDPFETGSFILSETDATDVLYSATFSGINFNGTISFIAAGPESIKVTWTQEPGLVGVPVGAVDALGFPLYLTLSDLDWVTPGPGTITGASVSWMPGPPTATIPFVGQFPATAPAPNISFTDDSVTLLFDNASVLQTIRSGTMATIDLTVEHHAVPEPLTIIGAGTAVAFGTGFKRKLGKAKKK